MRLFQTTSTTLLTLFASCAFTFALSAQGASFDCGKAKSKVEHLICDNPEISKLDDELNESYKAALKDKSQAAAIKKAQRLWVKLRNACAGTGCVKQAYEDQLKTLGISEQSADSSKVGMISSPAQADKAKSAEQALPQRPQKFRYGICDRSKPELSCEGSSGKGYLVCEDYLKHLQTLSNPPTCEAPVPPSFKQPDWVDMDVMQYLELAYQAEEFFLKKFGGYKHPDFDTWRLTFLQEIKDGKINPLMRKSRVTPNDKGEATILAYTRDRDACHKFYQFETRRKAQIDQLPVDTPAWSIEKQIPLYSASNYSSSNWIKQGTVHFILTENNSPSLQAIVGDVSRTQMDLLLYAGKAYLIEVGEPFMPIYPLKGGNPYRELFNSPIGIYAFDSRFPDTRPNLDLNHYLASLRCQFVPY